MRKLIFLLAVIPFILFTGFTIQSNKKVKNRNENGIKLTSKLQLQEQHNPLQYLSTEVMVKANLVIVKKESFLNDTEYKNDGYLIEGVITNKAELTNFKNIVFRVNFYSPSQTKIGSKDYILNQNYKPHTNNNISLKIYPPEGYVEFGFEIIDANGV